jgi:hypothetical protein
MLNDGWVEVRGRDGIWTARFPRAPTMRRVGGLPSFDTGRVDGGTFPEGDLYYVTTMRGRSDEPPPPELEQGILDAMAGRGLEALDLQVSTEKPFVDGLGNPGRDLSVTHRNGRTGLGRAVLDRRTGAILLALGFGDDAQAFIASTAIAPPVAEPPVAAAPRRPRPVGQKIGVFIALLVALSWYLGELDNWLPETVRSTSVLGASAPARGPGP